jgi:hypothetical protein
MILQPYAQPLADGDPFPSRLDLTRIAPKLYQGSLPPRGSALASAGFDVLVLCAQEFQISAEHYPGVRVIYAGIDDAGDRGPTAGEIQTVRFAALAACAEILAGKRVAVTCAQGRNRSALCNAFILRFLTGMPPKEIVKHLRAARPWVLTNTDFVAYILKHL